MFRIFHCFFSSTWTAFLLCFLSVFAHMLKITVFGHWQGSGLCECLVSSWIIPTELCSCPVMCRRAWFGCVSRNFFAMVDIVNTHTKAGIASCVECTCLCKAFLPHTVPGENFILNPDSACLGCFLKYEAFYFFSVYILPSLLLVS